MTTEEKKVGEFVDSEKLLEELIAEPCRESSVAKLLDKGTNTDVEYIMHPRTVEGAINAIKDVVEYLCREEGFCAFVAVGSTDKSKCHGNISCLVGTERDVATQLVCSMQASENIKNLVIKVGTLIAAKRDDMMLRIRQEEGEEVEDE